MTVQVVRVGDQDDGTGSAHVVRIGEPRGRGIAVGWERASLAELADVDDVDAAPVDIALVLLRDDDGRFRLVPALAGSEPYVHQQDDVADTWVVDHNLQRRPVGWSLYDAQDLERSEYRVEHPTVNRLVVRMDIPTAGTLYVI